MDSCLVCLECYDEITPRINDKSLEWQKYNVQRIIEKHLWWWHSKTEKNDKNQRDDSAWICQQCWENLFTFHRFYLRVEKVHRHYYTKCKGWSSYTHPYIEEQIITPIHRKQEEDCKDHNISLREDLIPLTKLCTADHENVKVENIAINEFATVDVKNEADDSLDSDYQEHNGSCSLHECPEDKYKGKNFNNQCTTVRDNSQQKRKTLCRRNITTRRNLHEAANKQGLSPTQIVKKYDDFIAANYELFCSVCHVPLSDFKKLKTHFQQEHNDSKPFVMCCGLKFHKRALLVDHLHTHKDPESFKCQLCSKALPNRRSLKSHFEWHDKTNKPKFQCDECNKIFFTRASCEKHKLSHVPDNEKHIPCSECDKKFASELLRLQHFNASHLKKYAKICDTCGKQFSNRDYFKRHLAEHTGIPTAPIQCDICGMKITSIYGLNRHKKLRHTEESTQEVTCPHCSKLIPNSAALRHHIEYAHKQRKHACNLCDKAFRRPKELREHLSTHTGETPYTCTHCSKTFKRHNKLYIHVKNQHPKEWEEARLNKLGAVPAVSGESHSSVGLE